MAGFHVLKERCVKLTVEQAKSFWQRSSKFLESDAENEIESFSSGPIIVLCLGRQDAIEGWKKLMGPNSCVIAKKSAPSSLQAIYGDLMTDSMNDFYGSQTEADVRNDLRFFFPTMILEPFQSGDPNNDYLSSVINQPLTDALYEMTKVKPDDPLEWLAHFMLEHNKNRPLIHGESHQLLQRMQTIEIKNTEQNI